MYTALLVVTHVVAAAAGAFGWPHVSSLVASWKASHAVANAKALIAKVEADAAALAAAKKVVAAAPVVVATPAVSVTQSTTPAA